MPESTVKIAVTATDNASPVLDNVSKKVEKVDTASERAGKSVASFGKSMGLSASTADQLGASVTSLAARFGPAALGGAFIYATKQAIEFDRAVSRIATLIPGQSEQLDALSLSARRLSKAYGMAASDVAAGTFQAISAGVEASKAAGFMQVAAESATAGFATMEETVTGLNVVLNSYGLAASQARNVSDAFFAANKLGVTTARELGASLGTVSSMAAAVGVSYHELLAATVALTKGGVSTAESMTGLRAIIASLVSPSEDAASAARELGITWDTSVLRAEGLSGVLDRLRVAQDAGGESMVSRLVPRVEATAKAFTLISETGAKDFNAALKEMTERSGQTAEALREVESSAAFRVKRSLESLKTSAGELGSTTLPALALAADFAGKTVGQWAEGLNVLDLANRSAYENFIILNRTFTPLGATIGALVNGYESLTGKTVDLTTSSQKLQEQTAALGDTLGSWLGGAVKSARSGLFDLAAEYDRLQGAPAGLGAEAAKSAEGLDKQTASVTANAAALERRRLAIDASLASRLALIDLEAEGLRQEQAGRDAFQPMGAGAAPLVDDKANAAFQNTGGGLAGGSIDEFAAKIDSAAEAQANFREELRATGAEMFDFAGPFARGMGTAIEAVINGEQSFGQAMRGMLRSTLATIGQESVVKGAFEVAAGFASLAAKDVPGAALHFKSAALFGAVGVGALVGSRALSGGGGGASGAGGGDGRRVPAGSGAVRPAEASAASSAQQAPVTEIYQITVQGSLVRERDLGRYVDESTGAARRSGASRG